MNKMEKNYFKQDAKQIVDMLFDNKIFREDVTRDDLNAVENHINFLLDSKFDSHLRLEKLVKKIEKHE